MDARILVMLTGLGLLGFLLYPRPDTPAPPGAVEWVTTARRVEGEPLRLAGVQRPDPPVETHDLGFVYRVDRMELLFRNANESGPRLYEILASPSREGSYQRIFTFHGSSRAYPYTVQRFPDSREARWVQVVVGDWFSGRPGVESLKVGPLYRRDWNPIRSVTTSHNGRDAEMLLDGLRDATSVWAGAKVEETTTEQDGEERTERAFLSPERDVTVVADLGSKQDVHGVRVTSHGDGAGVRRYDLALSDDGVAFTDVFSSGELPDEARSFPYMFDEAASARYVRWTIPSGAWHGAYPALREVEVFTDDYRPAPSASPRMQDYTPTLVREDNCGVDNRRAPNLTQGFAFDRGHGDDDARYMWSAEDVEGDASDQARSFSYHYDALHLRYTGLRPDRLYWIQALYLRDEATARRQNLIVDGYLLHGDEVGTPAGPSDPFTFAIPPAALLDGALDVEVNRLSGPNAVLSAAWLYEARPTSVDTEEDDGIAPARITRASGPKKIDGSLAEWDRLYPLDATSPGGPRAYAEWDSDNLYVAMVAPSSLFPNGAAVADTLDLFIDSKATASPALYRSGDVHLRIYRYGGGREVIRYVTHFSEEAAPRPNPPPVEMASATVGDEYVLEARIPRAGVLDEWSPGAGGRFGFNFIVSLRPERRWWLAAERRDDPPIRWREARMIGSIHADAWLGDERAEAPTFYAGDDVLVLVRDPDANSDPDAVDEVTVHVTGSILGDTRDLILREVRDGATIDPSAALTSDGEYFAAFLPTRYSDGRASGVGMPLAGGEAVTVTYMDRFATPDGAGAEVVVTATVLTGGDGAIELLDPTGGPAQTFRAGDTLHVALTDPDLPAPDAETDEPITTQVTARVLAPDESEPHDEETFDVVAAEGAEFIGSVGTTYGEAATKGDGVLQVRGMDRVEVAYADRVQTSGATNVDVVAAARVAIGATARLTLRGAGGRDDGGAPAPTRVYAGSPIILRVEDEDMNRDGAARESVEARLATDPRGDALRVILTETDIDTGVFQSLAPTAYAAAVDVTNGVLELRGAEIVTATYVDEIAGSGATNAETVATAVVSTGGDATLAIVRGDYVQLAPRLNAGATVFLRLVEPDARVTDLVVELRSKTTGDLERVVLAASAAGAAEYVGSLATAYGTTASPDDGVLSVVGDDLVSATYVDSLRASGATDTPVVTQARVNTGSDGALRLPPGAAPLRAGDDLLVEVRDPDLNVRSAVLEETTVTARVEPGGDTVNILLRETSGDSGVFSGAAPTAFAELAAVDDTLQIAGQSGITVEYTDAIRASGETRVPLVTTRYVETGVRGRLEILSLDGKRPVTRITPGDIVLARVTDGDLNADPAFDESTQARVTGSILGDAMLLPLRETGVDAGVFEVRVATERVPDGAAHDPYDLVLQVVDRELVTVTYIDDLTDAGEPRRRVDRSVIASVTGVGTLLLEDAYGAELGEFLAGASVYISLDEPSLAGAAEGAGPTVTLESVTTGDVVALPTEPVPGGQGRYWGRVATRYGVTPIVDDILEAQGGETVRARYASPGSVGDVFDTAAVAAGARGILTVTYADGRPLSTFTPGSDLHLRLEDADRDLTPFEVDEVDAQVTAQGGDRRTVRLVETAPSTGVFRGVAATTVTFDRSADGVGGLPLRGGEVVNVTYRDPLVETGQTDVEVTTSCRARRVGAAPYTDERFVIDGIPERWPLEDAMAPAEGGALVWAQWGRDDLYVFAEVADDDVRVADVTRWHEAADALELHFDLDIDRQGAPAHLGGGAPSEYVFWICPTGGGVTGDEPYVGRAQPTVAHNYGVVEIAVLRSDEGYSLEARIPFHTALPGFDPITSARRDRLGFNYLLYRSTAPQVWWAPLGGPSDSAGQAGILYLDRP